MSLVAHARKELEIAGLLDPSSDYDGMVGEAVLELMAVFAKQGHSGFSAEYTLEVFQQLARFKTLTPISSDPSEWMDVSEYSGRHMWQNVRQSSCFSEDDGRTWYDLDAPKQTPFKALRSRINRLVGLR